MTLYVPPKRNNPKSKEKKKKFMEEIPSTEINPKEPKRPI
jgi:hypothetical protein